MIGKGLIVLPLLPTNKRMKIAVFSIKSYEKEFLGKFNHEAKHDLGCKYKSGLKVR